MSIASAELHRLVCSKFKSILVINLLHLFFPFSRQQSNHIGTLKCPSQKIEREHPSGKCGDYDKGIYSFKIFKISIITIRITYHQTRLEKGR